MKIGGHIKIIAKFLLVIVVGNSRGVDQGALSGMGEVKDRCQVWGLC
jgi:hypothetical protein